MSLSINNDVENLSVTEQKTILKCKRYTYYHDKGLIALKYFDSVIQWYPIDVETAKTYLHKNSIYGDVELF